MAGKLDGEERDAALAGVPNWRWDPDRDGIRRTFRFRSFTEAFAFMTGVALQAERADHHPEWSNVWARVEMLLTTHSAGGLTHKDIALAHAADKLALRLGAG
jgi:4a-hydroxytetrahydrobiopterin dehydratase